MNAQSPLSGPPVTRIGIDAGGTFTDFVAGLPDGRFLHHKEPSNTEDPSEPIERGLRVLLEQGVAAHEDRRALIVHGTTIGLNAVLQRKGARVAVVVSRGMRDILEFERGRLPDYLNLLAGKPEPLVPRDHMLEIDARMAADGSILVSPSSVALAKLCDQIGALAPESVAVVLLNSYRDGALEELVAAAVRERFANMLVTCSAAVWPEIREYERAVVACLNARIHPLMDDYLAKLSSRIAAIGLPATLQLTTSSGGMLSLASARERPIETIMSGPAAGTVAAARFAKVVGIRAAISFDMGGTSADIAILSDGRFEFTTNSQIGGLPLMVPVVGVSSIGAGGGSILYFDAAGVLKVGPESAGSNPGPVCYGQGGARATVTDCYVVLGLIDPANFLGGRLRIDRQAAESALATIAGQLKLPSAAHAAEAALRIATARMATELFKLLAQGGYDPTVLQLMPFGGAGPTHAALLAEEAGLAGVAIPPAAATFCALGAVFADVRRDLLRSIGETRFAVLAERLWPTWNHLENDARDWLGSEQVSVTNLSLEYGLDMRYAGQAHNLLVPITEEVRQAEDLLGVAQAMHRTHEALYGFREADERVEVVSVRLSIIGKVPEVTLPMLAEQVGDPRPRGRRPVFHKGTWIDAGIYTRADLLAGASLVGPAIITQSDTTIWVPPTWRLSVHQSGVLFIWRSDGDAA
jgi:N-methylhydantoinase A